MESMTCLIVAGKFQVLPSASRLLPVQGRSPPNGRKCAGFHDLEEFSCQSRHFIIARRCTQTGEIVIAWCEDGASMGRHTARSSRADAEAAEEIYSSVHRHTGAPYAQREANSLRAVRYFRETSYPLPSPFRRTNIFPEAEVRISSTKRPFTIVER